MTTPKHQLEELIKELFCSVEPRLTKRPVKYKTEPHDSGEFLWTAESGPTGVVLRWFGEMEVGSVGEASRAVLALLTKTTSASRIAKRRARL